MATARGALTWEQSNLILETLPCDLSFADEDDVLVYWRGGTYETCDESFIGRDVRDCHPGRSAEVLEEILTAFHDGTRDAAEGWRVTSSGRFKYTLYRAVRDAAGSYMGILEINHDITDLRALEGTRALPGW